MLGVAPAVKQGTQPLGRADAEVMRAFRADVEALFEVLLVDELCAARALDPETLWNAACFSAVEDAMGLRVFLNHAIKGY